MGIGRIMRCKNKEEFQKLGKYIIEREGKWETMVRKNESEVEVNLDG
jgi:hypothetical protein